MSFRKYLPHRSDRLALVSRKRPAGAHWPIRVFQIVGGKRWSLALVVKTTPAPVRTLP